MKVIMELIRHLNFVQVDQLIAPAQRYLCGGMSLVTHCLKEMFHSSVQIKNGASCGRSKLGAITWGGWFAKFY